ncbi:AraC family transcriptional regulator [Cellulophaga sp. 20_2_10]|uniref:AraC family transcriptional regulator n=1 Tax=Cellulophaga sp. 20_2_10 TaxID=2942476 RepID=UPI00201A7385|nr:helix-turn-helix transcriptional regulator [Cellulophaga sp. 20_2_10]MCL5246148.1 AraC family transcriptional regulator [Cellulophaga sp. 20_2_10]
MPKKIENIIFSQFVNQTIPFELITIEELYTRCRLSNYNLSDPHRIEFHAIIVITEGESTHTSDFKEEKLFPGVILPLTKGQVHSFNKQLTVKGYVISFDETFIMQNISEKNLFHFLHLSNTPNIYIGQENLSVLQPYIKILETEVKNERPNLKSEFLQSALMLFLLQIKRLSILKHTTFESKRFKDFIAFKHLICSNHKESHNAKDYASKMGISYKYLNDICKEITSKTAKSFIDNWLILETKRNLSEKKYTSQQIAFKMGFKEHSNFIRFFKKATGKTPSKFQNQL